MGTGSLASILAPSVADRPGVEEWWGRVERYGATPGHARARLRAIIELDVRDVLPLVDVPTLVVHNRDDAFVRVGHGRYLAEHIPGARLLERDSADHWPLPEPDLLGAIKEFVTGSRSEVADPDRDRFLATVLFVDVVGSTQYASEFGDQSWPRHSIASSMRLRRRFSTSAEHSSVRPAMESWRRSRDLLAQFAARLTSATRFGAAVSRSDVASMPAR